MCPVDTTSATNQPYDFSSLSPHIDMESASSKVILMAKSSLAHEWPKTRRSTGDVAAISPADYAS